LSFLEGPIVAFVAGTLAAVGYFNIYFLAAFFFVRDIGLDGAYYAIGHFGGRTAFAKRMLKKVGVTEDHIDSVRGLWSRRPLWTMCIGKLSYGIASAFIVVAGMVKMPLRKFFTYGSIVAVLQYGTLLLLGYFLGASVGGSVTKVLKNVGYVIAFAGVALVGYYLLTLRMRKTFLKKDEEIEKEPVEGESHA
jgi:membrane protein DedA with SNARE-associated domain